MPLPKSIKDSWYEAAKKIFHKNQFGGQALSSIFYGHALLRVTLPESIKSLWYASAKVFLQNNQFESQQLSNIFYGHAQLGFPLPKSIRESWYQSVKAALHKNRFSSQALSNIFYGHAQLGTPLPNLIRDFWYKSVKIALEKDIFNEQQLSNIFYGHAQLGMPLPKSIKDSWYEAAKKIFQKNQFSSQALSNIFYGHAQLGTPLPDSIKNFWNESANMTIEKGHFNDQQLFNIFYGSALLGLPNDEFLKDIFISIKCSIEKIKNPSIENISAYYIASMFYDYEIENRENTIAYLKENVNVSTSKLQKTIEDVSKNIFGHIESEFFVDGVGSCVDIYVPKHNLIIEVDGPYHFIRDESGQDVYNPRSNLKTGLLKRLGYTVERIHYKDVDDHLDQVHERLRAFTQSSKSISSSAASDNSDHDAFQVVSNKKRVKKRHRRR